MMSKTRRTKARKREPMPFDRFVRMACYASRPTWLLPGDERKVRLMTLRARLRLPVCVKGDASADEEGDMRRGVFGGAPWKHVVDS